MARILFIETSTALCSTALSEDGKIISTRENQDRKHASLTAPFIQEMLDEKNLTVKDCDAVCVSMGPGSYTGLRVGASTAKGLCFGAGLPLMAVGSLDTLVWQAIRENLLHEGCKYIVPMIDARRMEVYTAVFTPDGKQVTETKPEIVEVTVPRNAGKHSTPPTPSSSRPVRRPSQCWCLRSVFSRKRSSRIPPTSNLST